MATSIPPSFTLSMSFNGQKIPSSIPVHLPTQLTRQQLLHFPAFQDWLTRLLANLALQDDPAHTFHARPFRLHHIHVESVVWFGPKPGFIKVQAKVQNYEDSEAEGLSTEEKEKKGIMRVPGAVLLRGGSVGVLVLIRPYDDTPSTSPHAKDEETYTLLTIQPRIASGSLAFPEIPAGMLDGSNNFGGKAAQEIREETGLVIHESEMLDMSALATSDMSLNPSSTSSSKGSNLKESIENAMYPSVGACDEFLPLFLCQKRMARAKLEALRDRKTGLRDEGEAITVKVVPFRKLWKEGGRDGKALAALGLYHALEEEGLLPAWPTRSDDQDK